MSELGRFFDDFHVGEQFVTPARTVGEPEVSSFAQLTGDFNPLHTDAAYAATTPFGGRIAHGLLGLSLVPGLVSRLGLFDGTAVAVLGIDSWAYRQPIMIGDTVHVRLTISSMRETSDGKRGVLGRQFELLNQHGALVQEGSIPILMRRR